MFLDTVCDNFHSSDFLTSICLVVSENQAALSGS